MTLCPYSNKFQPTTRCQVPHCGGFVCPCSGRCNREEKFSPDAHAELNQKSMQDEFCELAADREPGAYADVPPISAGDDAALIDLRWHWDEAYEIDCSGGAWVARFKADTVSLSGGSADALRKLIRQDYLDRTSPEQSGRAGARTGALVVGNGERALRLLRGEGII